MIVIFAELERGGSSVATVGESPTSSSPKIIARSEAKIKKRIFPITVQILPQKTLDNHTPNCYTLFVVSSPLVVSLSPDRAETGGGKQTYKPSSVP